MRYNRFFINFTVNRLDTFTRCKILKQASYILLVYSYL